ncbi:MAG: TrmH family RNA methyltransferase [Chitinophagales bacterium]|nr:TrmH family RNA methyltransferase [Bacteroidota bacterium]MCB9043360.1 TrmH family RNA methyltransferase [Chitinophagales bacterium]
MQKVKNEDLGRLSVAAFQLSEKLPVCVVLDNIRSALNVGSVFRSCDGFATTSIYLCGITAQPPHKEIHKTAIGATESVAWQYFDNTSAALIHLRQEGYRIFAIEQAMPRIWLQDFKVLPHEKYAFVFGNEVAGVSEEALQFCEACIEIPQMGTKHSFNISVSAGIVLWDFYSKYLQNKKP